MHRRDFLRTSSLAAAVLGTKTAAAAPSIGAPAFGTPGIGAPAILTKTLELTIASPWKPASSGYPDQVFGFARRLEQTLGGRLKLHHILRTGGAIETLNSGASDLYIGPEHANVSHHPAFGFFAGLPGDAAADPQAFEAWLVASGGQDLWDELSGKFGVKALMCGHTGPAPGLWSTRRLRTLSDIKGEQIWVQGLARDVVTAIGARASDLGPNSAVDGLARREIIAAEWGNATHSLAAGFPSVARFCTLSSFSQQGSVLALTVKREVWDRLTHDLQITLSAAAADEARRTAADWRANDEIMRRALTETLQIGFVPLPRDMSTAIAKVSGAVIAEVAAKDGLSARINASYMRFFRLAAAGQAKMNSV